MPADRLFHPRAGKSRKVTMLTDLEFRVWVQYLMSADDFGVMRCAAVEVQADNIYLSNRPTKIIQRCLEVLVKDGGLLHTFEHQGQLYAFQHDWQHYQKIDYPRATHDPMPPEDKLAICDEATRRLFGLHPGGNARKKHKYLERTSQMNPEDIPPTRAYAPAERLTANGKGLTANGSEGMQGKPSEPSPIDEWALRLVDLYPAQGRCGHLMIGRPLFDVLTADPAIGPLEAWVSLQARLEQQKASHQWRVKQMIPRLDKWLREGLHLQELPEHAPATADRAGKPAWLQKAAGPLS